MKQFLFLGLLTVGAWQTVSATLYSVGNVNGSGTSLNQTIYDATPSGVSSSLLVSGQGGYLSGLTLTLNVSGGYNGDLYAYLSYNGTLVTLLNRVGMGSGNAIQSTYGFSTTGFNNVTLSDAGTGGNIHDAQTPGSAVSYTADGGNLSSFNGTDPNGTWTLFFADLSGGNTSTLNGWSLDITAVPEPVNVALGAFGGLFTVAGLVKIVRRRKAAWNNSSLNIRSAG
jgi:subtilisin-like proprotein convertase family protein